jgi:cell shape-determining protein MreC
LKRFFFSKNYKHENESLKKNIKDLNEEQENLLVLLQEMEDKCKDYKNILRSNGYTNFGDDDLEEEDDLT